ncbi:type I restriction enzyme, S subunit [Loktanella sp. DSM 29012]|uniref:restriction endonuclease subunit S n=1 Tax=Loktanella sp. DSM 29012 TaxID=1881056 RepID=UPI0008CA726A|nr:restriction endonuclease subunit S [Loktanella sp. DSM 29012]SEP66234.1 type I restriction enzyme, S subunit [Loktanella sp. DSM 29012]
MTAKIDISPEQLAIVQGILKDHLPKGTLAWAFGSRVTWTAKPFSDLDIALEGAAPLPSDVLIDLEEAFEASDLPWKVDVIDLNAVSPEFRAIVERQRVPADWEEVELRRVADLLAQERGISVGVMYPGNDTPNGVPLIRAGDIKNGVIDPNIQFRISESIHKEYSRTELVGGEILITLVGNPGVVAIVPPEMKGWNAARAVAVVRLEDPEDNGFFRAAMATPSVQHTIRNVCNTTVQATLNLRDIKALELPWPEKPVRDQISKIVAMFDDKIELNRRMNETLEAMARAVFRDWFVDFGPTRRKAAGETDPAAILGGLLPDPTQAPPLAALFPDNFGDNGLPEGWAVGTIADIAQKLQNGGTPRRSEEIFWKNGTIPWLTSGEVRQDFILDATNKITDAGLKGSSAKLIPSRCILVALYGATAGQVSMNKAALTTNQAICAVLPNEQNRYFLFLTLKASVEDMENRAVGSAQQNISKKAVEDTKCLLANKTIVGNFDSLVQPVFDLIFANLEENQTLAATRDLLLPKLMSGDLRLTGAEGVV